MVGAILTRRSVSTTAPGANDVWGLDGNFAFYRNVYFSGFLAQPSTTAIGVVGLVQSGIK